MTSIELYHFATEAYLCLAASGSNIVVEQITHDPEFMGLNPDAALKERKEKKCQN